MRQPLLMRGNSSISEPSRRACITDEPQPEGWNQPSTRGTTSVWKERERRTGGASGSAAASVGLAAVVRLGAAGAQLASFCLCHSAGSVPVSVPYRRVGLRCGDWAFDDISLAVGFSARLVGMRRKDIDAVLLPVRSIHTWGMRQPIRVIGIDASGVVIATAVVGPRSVVRWKVARWILELPEGVPPPPIGHACTVLA